MKGDNAVDETQIASDNEAGDAEKIDAKAHKTAHGLIQGYMGPDHKVLDMQRFYRALVQALKRAAAGELSR